MKSRLFFLFLFAALNILIGCSESTNTPDEEDSIPKIDCYNLIWNDEFDKNFIDPRKWEHEINANGGGNNELQYYTSRLENSYVKNGKLFINAINEEYTGSDGTRNFTSARLRTINKGDWKYGRIEVSAKIPSGRGTWPAIWMLPTDWEYGGWPESGEIDIMEHVGFAPNVIHVTVHTKAYNHKIGTQVGNKLTIPTAITDFHTYSIEWFEDRIDFFIDENKYFTFHNANAGWEKWPFDKRFHLILNVAVGGDWGGREGIDTEIFPATMEIDYVRVYEKSK